MVELLEVPYICRLHGWLRRIRKAGRIYIGNRFVDLGFPGST
jgi:hypothetical protein